MIATETAQPIIVERGFPECQCRDCRYPTQANIDTRLVHRDRHEEFRVRYQTPATDTERGMWQAVQMLDALQSTEPLVRSLCDRPEHGGMPRHPETH